ncbi:NADPH-dependent 2,4-dienoyl-CoA reductase, sulfur reductase [Variovorax sp. YR750]|uniref:NAD(P)/FAD-dependent oxidoreductase n=1 Tax=Variovorax sp. YR750 TaxID=1884384 RepID=UPI0008D04E2B|nr:NAD(P)/FAD-dependent oxidoreductase [Variovorax sp. YR750]SEM03913.1 NADPH-dependent 2,4-dienoyl-CoA reductase, sulfur reductase [Variovorax sp. YR750]
MTTFTHDLVVIGAGPAGISAALTAASCGLKTLLLDEQLRAGGQIYRNITAVQPSVAALLGPDYRHGETLANRLVGSGVELGFGSAVWDVARDLTVTAQKDGQSFQARSPQLIAATGAMERPSPIPGWTLPGVLNAGAAQITLKSAGAVPAGRVVLTGSGPLLLLVACQLLDAGVSVVGIVETSARQSRWHALRHLPAALRAPAYLAKGARMLWRLRRQGIPIFSAATGLRVEGQERAQALAFKSGGSEYRMDADVVLLHHGVVPNTQLSRLLRVEHDWDPDQVAWRPRVDPWGETSLAGFRIAGDGAGIAGALAAEPAGVLAALGAARALDRLTDSECDARAKTARGQLEKQLRIRPFLDALYRPPSWLADPEDETIVCRCEEVTAGRIREMARLGCQGPNQTKFFSRCGMGPCQGRMCGLTVTQILATELGKNPVDVGAYHIRAPLKPVPLASLASLATKTSD